MRGRGAWSTSVAVSYTYGYDYDTAPPGPPASSFVGAALATAYIPQFSQPSQTVLDISHQLPPGGNGATAGTSIGGDYGIRAAVTNHKGVYIATVSLSGFANSLSANLTPDTSNSGDSGYYEYDASASIGGSSSLCTGGLTGAFINHDDPTNQTSQPLGGLVYGGSEESTADELLLSAADTPPVAGTAYTWAVSGPGSSLYPLPPSTVAVWNVGWIHAIPGILSFMCQLNRPDGSFADKCINVEVGIRTDDVVMTGWIDQTGVPNPNLPAQYNGVHAQILSDLPTNGGSFVNGGLPNLAGAARIAFLAANDDHYDEDYTNPATVMTAADRNYILDWMFYYAPNPDPVVSIPGDFRHAPTSQVPYPYMDYASFANFTGVNNLINGQKTKYKLINHFQVKYRTNGIQFLDTPTILHNDALVGDTVNPTGAPPNFPFPVPSLGLALALPILAPANLYAYLISPQYGPENGLTGMDTAWTQIAQINDGSPDIFGVRAFNTLEGLDVPSPVFWENIGSKITFQCPLTTPKLVPQVYPTYNYYKNGIDQKTPFVQFPTPTGNFNTAPYPFGTVTSVGLIPGTPSIPGGRNGVAGLPPGPTVRVPPPLYTVLP